MKGKGPNPYDSYVSLPKSGTAFRKQPRVTAICMMNRKPGEYGDTLFMLTDDGRVLRKDVEHDTPATEVDTGIQPKGET